MKKKVENVGPEKLAMKTVLDRGGNGLRQLASNCVLDQFSPRHTRVSGSRASRAWRPLPYALARLRWFAAGARAQYAR
jgi:hypothetical protein